MTRLQRLAKCGLYRHAAAPVVTIVKGSDGLARYGGLAVCGSVWACPVCSAAIRERRGAEIELAGRRHLEAGGGLEFVTLTLPHDRQDALAVSLDAVAKSWTAVLRSRGFRAVRESLGLENVRAVEVTYGLHGWHPHLHVLLFSARPLEAGERVRVSDAIAAAWSAAVTAAGFRAPSAEHGVRLQAVHGVGGADALARYLTKIQDEAGMARDVAREIVRGDLKAGRRKSSVTPFEIVERAAGGDKRMVALWREYEAATHGRACMTWSKGLRRRLIVDVPELDNETAAASVTGEFFAYLGDRDWRLITRYGWELRVLRWVEDGGVADELAGFLAPLTRRELYEERRPAPGRGLVGARRA